MPRPVRPVSDPPARPRAVRFGSLATGAFLLAAYLRFGAEQGFDVRFGGGPSRKLEHIATGELQFWLAHALLVVPGVLALAHAVAPWVVGAFERLGDRIDGPGRARWRALAFAFVATVFVVAQLGHRFVLLDLPVTDDENSVRFGARVLASGQLTAPALEPPNSYTNLFLIERDGRVTSMDFPGTLAFAAAAELLGRRSLLYALAAALTGLVVAATAGRLLGRRGAVLAGLFWLFSPMVFTLSLTTHAQIFSRLCAAGAFWLYAALATRERGAPFAAQALGLGLVVGLGFAARPAETAALLWLPGAHLMWLALRGQRGGAAVAGLALAGLAPLLLLHGWYNAEVVGGALEFGRWSDAAATSNIRFLDRTVLTRFGQHTAYNALMLAVWFLGPVGLVLAWLGVTRERPLSGILMGSVLSVLAITLLHDDIGMHMVGPIHFSECAVPLVLLAVLGVERIRGWAQANGIARVPLGWWLASYCVVGLGIFLGTYAGELRKQAEFQAEPFRALRARGVHQAVVLASPPSLREKLGGYRAAGSWVLKFPPPDPYLRDDIVFARHDADVAALQARFPERAIFRLVYADRGRKVEVEAVASPRRRD